MTMTAGEYAVEVADLPGGQFDTTPQPGPPAASPEAAVRTLLDAAQAEANTGRSTGDPLSGLFPAAQTRAMRVYAKAYGSALDQAGGSFLGTDSTSGGPSDSTIYPTDPGSGGTATFNGLQSECSGCGVSYNDLQVRTVAEGAQTRAADRVATVTAKDQVCDTGFSIDGAFGGGTSGDWTNSDGSSSHGTFGDGSGGTVVVPATPDVSGSGASGCTTQTETVHWDGKCLSSTSSDATFEGQKGCLDESKQARRAQRPRFRHHRCAPLACEAGAWRLGHPPGGHHLRLRAHRHQPPRRPQGPPDPQQDHDQGLAATVDGALGLATGGDQLTSHGRPTPGGAVARRRSWCRRRGRAARASRGRAARTAGRRSSG